MTITAEQRQQTADEANQRETLAQLYGRMGDRIFRFFYRKVRDREEARDLKQEVFVEAAKGLRHFRGDASLETWIFSIARHVWSKRDRTHRRAKRRGVVEPLERHTDDGRPGLQLPAPEETPHEAAERSQETTLVRGEIEKMPDPMRQCIQLHMDQGFSHPEIASILQIPVGTAKSHVSRARQRLKEIFSNRPAKIPPEESP